MRIGFLVLLLLLVKEFRAQVPILRTDTIPVIRNSVQLANPWVGGHNFVQVSDIDLNFDGIKDLFVFDRTGNKISTYINQGIPNTVSYVHAPQYEKMFPSSYPYLTKWVLMYDYNYDGLKDIMSYSNAGFSVRKNISVSPNLQFQLITPLAMTEVSPSNWINLYVSNVDLPAFADIDNDGDMDVVTFSFNGTSVEYHKNRSMELYGSPDSLVFQYITNNWGEFTENSSNCGINLQRQNPQYPEPLHAGSCLLCLDMDNDRALELLVGDISCCSVAMLYNGGDSAYADFTSFDAQFPTNSLSVDMSIFPCGFHLDVNNDGKRDLVVCASAENVSENRQSIWYYENTGTEQFPVFSFIKKDLLQSDMIDVGEGSFPCLVDYDQDGLTDLLIGNVHYRTTQPNCVSSIATRIIVYRNTGTATSPEFTWVTDNWNNLDADIGSLLGVSLSFGDIDNDNDLDMFIGDNNGNVHYFPNTAGAGNPIAFGTAVMNYMDNNSNPIDVGQNACIQVIDLDIDQRLDLVIGEKGGNLNYYRNVGTVSTPSFQFMTDTLGDVDVTPTAPWTGYSTPFIYSDSGQYELLVGSESGTVYLYKNITGNVSGAWTLSDSIGNRPNEVFEGIRTSVCGKDITNDGILDVIIGNYRGGMGFYKGDVSVGMEIVAEDRMFRIYPNPASGGFYVSMPPASGPVMLDILDVCGRVLDHRLLAGQPAAFIGTSSLSPGVYSIVISHSGRREVHRIILH